MAKKHIDIVAWEILTNLWEESLGENPGIESLPISCLSQGAFINYVQICGVHEIQTSVKRNIVLKIRTSGVQKAPIALVLTASLKIIIYSIFFFAYYELQ